MIFPPVDALTVRQSVCFFASERQQILLIRVRAVNYEISVGWLNNVSVTEVVGRLPSATDMINERLRSIVEKIRQLAVILKKTALHADIGAYISANSYESNTEYSIRCMLKDSVEVNFLLKKWKLIRVSQLLHFVDDVCFNYAYIVFDCGANVFSMTPCNPTWYHRGVN